MQGKMLSVMQNIYFFNSKKNYVPIIYLLTFSYGFSIYITIHRELFY